MSTFGEVQFDIALPQAFIDGRPDPDAIAAFAANAEQLGSGLCSDALRQLVLL